MRNRSEDRKREGREGEEGEGGGGAAAPSKPPEDKWPGGRCRRNFTPCHSVFVYRAKSVTWSSVPRGEQIIAGEGRRRRWEVWGGEGVGPSSISWNGLPGLTASEASLTERRPQSAASRCHCKGAGGRLPLCFFTPADDSASGEASGCWTDKRTLARLQPITVARRLQGCLPAVSTLSHWRHRSLKHSSHRLFPSSMSASLEVCISEGCFEGRTHPQPLKWGPSSLRLVKGTSD